VRIGGKITGVDENLRAAIRQLGASGQASPWSLNVPFHAAPGQLITIVVHTSGHVAAVERFAVTAVLVG
jgi:hypothetical protein